jgi:hypothetical protein
MHMGLDALDLRSGRWVGTIDTTGQGAFLELVHAANTRNKMRLQLPDDWRSLGAGGIEQLARRPEVRLWVDEARIPWRVSVVGPGTAYPYPLRARHLVFDSARTWAGIVIFEGPLELGDLTDLELQRLRDRIADFGGRRRGYRPPPAAPASGRDSSG